MSYSRSYGSIILATLLLLAGQILMVPSSVSAHPSAPLNTVPTTIEVPPGHALLFRSHAQGFQIYECQNSQWVFRAPRAGLFAMRFHWLIGKHYGGIDRGLTAGPWWESIYDGSRVRGGNAVSAPSPNPNSIPLLRLEVLERHGSGRFSQVSYIQRLNTVGGVGPSGTCQTGAQRWVPYTADYYFYGAR